MVVLSGVDHGCCVRSASWLCWKEFMVVVLTGVICSCVGKSRRLLVMDLSLNFHLLNVAGWGGFAC